MADIRAQCGPWLSPHFPSHVGSLFPWPSFRLASPYYCTAQLLIRAKCLILYVFHVRTSVYLCDSSLSKPPGTPWIPLGSGNTVISIDFVIYLRLEGNSFHMFTCKGGEP